jgi:hypothetical protein
VNNELFAQQFNNLKSANDYLLSPMMVKINKDNGKVKFTTKEIEDGIGYEDIKEKKDFDKAILEEIKTLDDCNNDFSNIKMSDEDNHHVYSGKTYIEENDIDIAEFMKTAVKVFACLETYVENMCYLEREADLDLLDYRHYKRDEETRMDSISASRLEYIEQETERNRITYKRNRLIGQIMLKDINRIKNDNFIKVVDNVVNSEYKYRRTTKDKIKEMISTKKTRQLKAI